MTEPFGQYGSHGVSALYLQHVTERFGQGRSPMKLATLLSMALAMGLSLSASMSPALAAVHDTSSRDAMIAKCTAQAHSQYPGNYRDWGDTRSFAYDTCMHNAGQPE
jgi:hypothetical protein